MYKVSHTQNHQPKGKLYNLKPKLKDFKGATFMTMVRWDMLDKLKAVSKDIRVDVTYGAATKEARRDLKIKKSHANDAYCMGSFHPSHRTDLKCYEKCRRNNRVLSKFYDATYIDIRDGEKKKANALGCNRTKRRESRRSEKNERIYRGGKMSKGRIVLRTKEQSSVRVIWSMLERKIYRSVQQESGCAVKTRGWKLINNIKSNRNNTLWRMENS